MGSGGRENGENGGGTRGGVGVVSLLQILFIAFKLAKVGVVGDWAWWIVMLPTIITSGVVCLICFCGVGCLACMQEKKPDESKVMVVAEPMDFGGA